MKPSCLLCLLLLTACGAKKVSHEYGKTSSAALMAEEGEPLQKVKIPKNGEVFIYPQDKKYQFNDDVLTHSFIRPQGDERLLLYWRHRFKECATEERELPSATKGHAPPEYEFICAAEGISVIYQKGSGEVSRIIEYAKK
jgi:hypothetical protein